MKIISFVLGSFLLLFLILSVQYKDEGKDINYIHYTLNTIDENMTNTFTSEYINKDYNNYSIAGIMKGLGYMLNGVTTLLFGIGHSVTEWGYNNMTSEMVWRIIYFVLAFMIIYLILFAIKPIVMLYFMIKQIVEDYKYNRLKKNILPKLLKEE